jgi:hypothetical protein
MKRYLILAVLLAFPALPPGASAQNASEAQSTLIQEIGKCLFAGLPPDWRQTEMFVTLAKPGAEGGDARYTMIRSMSGGEIENFMPCTDPNPAKVFVTEIRKQQAKDKRGWTSARLIIYREGKFDLTFQYPKPK